MELNLTKENICVNEQCYSDNLEHGVNFEVVMPDYCAAVQRILRSAIVPRITSKNHSAQALSIDGELCFSVLYLDEEGCLHCFEHNEPFSKNIPTDERGEGCRFTVEAKCGYFNAKAISPRRLEVNSVVQLSVKGVCKRTTQIISDIDCCDIFQNRGEAAATSPICSAEKNIIIEEELELGHTQPGIKRILRSCIVPSVGSYKIINQKVVVKGELRIDILYCADGRNRTEKFNATLPFSQIVDIEGINENCDCDIALQIISSDIKTRTGYDGETNSFLINAKLCINIDAVCNNEISVIYDAYSPKHKMELISVKTPISKIIDEICEVYICKKKIDFSDGDICGIVDLWCDCIIHNCHTTDSSVIIGGAVNVSMICENSAGEINFFERPIDFEYRYDAGELPQKVHCVPKVCVLNSGYSISGDNSLDIRVELQINASVYEDKILDVLSDIKIGDKCTLVNSDYSMIIYYASCGETVWDIAKRFNTSPYEICNINEISDVLESDKTLLIPC